MPSSVNDTLHELAIGRSIDLQQYSIGVARRLVALLNRSDAELAARLGEVLARVDASMFSVERLEQLLTSVKALNTAVYQIIAAELSAEVTALAGYEVQYQRMLWTAVMPAEVTAQVTVAAVSEWQAAAAALSRPFQGRLLSGWAAKLPEDRMTLMREQIRQGYVQSETTDQIVRRIRGTRARQYEDGIISRSRREMVTIVRTAIGHTAASARDKFYEANAQLVAAVAWSATLDMRTSPLCMVRDLKRYNLPDHKPVGHKLPWLQGPGRSHFNCRSCSTPVTRSFRELGIPIDEMTPSTRASMDGQVPAKLSYGDWLQRQSPQRQDQVLGKERAELMRSGRVPFDMQYTDRGLALTLADLKRRDAEAHHQEARHRAGFVLSKSP